MADKLKLFSVTLDWGSSDSDEGDYANWTWATDEDAAIRQVAEEMAASGEKHFDTDAEYTEYVEEVIANAGIYAASEVTAVMGPEIEMLMMGPEGQWSAEASRDFNTIKTILAKYGVGT